MSLNSNTPRSQVYVLCGAPGSGKSTWADKHLKNCAHISRDQIRYSVLKEGEDYFAHERETFRLFIDEIASWMCVGKNVAIDASHLNPPSRRKLTRALDAKGYPFDLYFIYFNTPLEVCYARNDQRIGRANVPHEVIKEMYDKATIPTFDEHPNIKGIWVIKE